MADQGNNAFEVFLTKDAIDQSDWLKLYRAIAQYSGFLPKFKVHVSIQENLVRYFVDSPKDLSSLSNDLEGLIIRQSEQLPEVPSASGRLRFLQFKAGGNLFDLKEKYEIKKGLTLEHFVCSVRAFNSEKAIIKLRMYFKSLGGGHVKATKTLTSFPAHLLEADFAVSGKYMKKDVGRYLNIEKAINLLSSSPSTPLFKVDGFPYLSKDYFVNLTDYEFDKHSFIVGASGTGKSKFISLYVDRLANSAMRDNYRVVIIDPHAALEHDFKHLASKKIVNFAQDGAELFGEEAQDIQAATELTTVLFKSLMGGQDNPRLEKVLRFSLYVLLTSRNMSLDSLKRFLTEVELRNQLLDHVKGYVPDNVIKFFGGDFSEIYTQHYNQAIQPILSLVDEMQLQPSMVGHNDVSLAKTIQDNFLTVFSLKKVSMGEKVTKTISGLLIQQIFLLAQSRTLNKKVILIIDEVSIVQNPALAQILSEARKFNLSVILTQQYFGQIEKALQESIFANVFNYYAFKVSEEDARALEGNLNIELPQTIVEADKEKGLKEKDTKIKLMTELNPRECLIRLAAHGQIYPCVKGSTVEADFIHQAGPREIREDLEKVAKPDLPAKFVEGQKPQAVASSPDADDDNTPGTGATEPVAPTPQPQAAAPIHQSMETTPQETDLPDDETLPGMINLSSLLSEHSSSRKLVNKRKAKK